MFLQALTTREALRICHEGYPRPDLFIHENGAYVILRHDSTEPIPADARTSHTADATADSIEEFEIVTHSSRPPPNCERPKDACIVC